MSIDLDFRPRSYADFADPVSLAVNGINGQMRRTMVRDMLTAEGELRELHDAVLGPIEPEILEQSTGESSLQSVSPVWMGGEYLPPLKPGETEIARVVLRSATMDVFSLRARWNGSRYHYRVVDEYGSTITLCRKTSLRPLTLRQVIEVLDSADGDLLHTEGAGLVVVWWNQQLEYCSDPQECTDFAWVESEIYPELAAWYEERARLWREEQAHPETLADAVAAIWSEMEELTGQLRIATGGSTIGYGLRQAAIHAMERAKKPFLRTTGWEEAVAVLESMHVEMVAGRQRRAWCERLQQTARSAEQRPGTSGA